MENTAEEQAREEVQRMAVEINDIAYEMESRYVTKLHIRGCSQQFRTCLTTCIRGPMYNLRHGKGSHLISLTAVWEPHYYYLVHTYKPIRVLFLHSMCQTPFGNPLWDL